MIVPHYKCPICEREFVGDLSWPEDTALRNWVTIKCPEDGVNGGVFEWDGMCSDCRRRFLFYVHEFCKERTPKEIKNATAD